MCRLNCGMVADLIKSICCRFNCCSLIGCVSGMPGSGCSRWAVHSFQEPRGGVIGRWPYLGGAVGGILPIHWHVLQGPSHLTDALPLVSKLNAYTIALFRLPVQIWFLCIANWNPNIFIKCERRIVTNPFQSTFKCGLKSFSNHISGNSFHCPDQISHIFSAYVYMTFSLRIKINIRCCCRKYAESRCRNNSDLNCCDTQCGQIPIGYRNNQTWCDSVKIAYDYW